MDTNLPAGFYPVPFNTYGSYNGTTYDRGHMCPAYAMFSRHGPEGFLATFICSNIIPQPHSVNAGI